MVILLAIIYVTFISLGLPDAVLGSAWPAMYQSLNANVASAGIMSMIICGGTIISSMFSGKLIAKFGTGKLTTFSVFLTALALIGISLSPIFLVMCLWAVPLGLGAGAVDSALNNFVALHYKAIHMNWLHCFWGIGATSGPLIISFLLKNQFGWRNGYLLIGMIQMVLVIILFLNLNKWMKNSCSQTAEDTGTHGVSIKEVLEIPGAKSALVGFLAYCGIESTVSLWGSSYLVFERNMSSTVAASWISLFFIGITFGRFLSGFLSIKLNNQHLIRIGQVVIFLGVVVMMFFGSDEVQGLSFILIGLGCAPIYPSMLHETPQRFGSRISQSMMGIQMASAYIGSTCIPPIIGFLATEISFKIFPLSLFLLILTMNLSYKKINAVSTETVNM